VEKRKQSRSEVALAVDMSCMGTEYHDLVTRNVSLGGVLLEPGEYPPPVRGANAELRFKTVAGSPRALQARVQRVDAGGVALVFRDFDLDDFNYLQQVLAGRTG
jgi:hypothetical protein